MDKRCTGELHTHRLLQWSGMNLRDPGIWKKHGDVTTVSISVGGIRSDGLLRHVWMLMNRGNPRKPKREDMRIHDNEINHKWFGLCTLYLCYPHLNSICFSCRVTMATRGGRPVLRVCSSTLDAMICVVISASAATPAPQQLQNIQEFNKFNKSNHYRVTVETRVRTQPGLSLLWNSGFTH